MTVDPRVNQLISELSQPQAQRQPPPQQQPQAPFGDPETVQTEFEEMVKNAVEEQNIIFRVHHAMRKQFLHTYCSKFNFAIRFSSKFNQIDKMEILIL